jgi:ATP-binding cassette subfamily F protein 3
MLKEYPGAILFVSHDRYFIDAIADKLWILNHGRLDEYLGNYSEYTEALHQAEAQQPVAEPRSTEATAVPTSESAAGNGRPSPEERQRRKRIAALEAEVTVLEQELAQIQAELEQASAAQDLPRIGSLGKQYAELEALLAGKYAQWEQLAA